MSGSDFPEADGLAHIFGWNPRDSLFYQSCSCQRPTSTSGHARHAGGQQNIDTHRSSNLPSNTDSAQTHTTELRLLALPARDSWQRMPPALQRMAAGWDFGPCGRRSPSKRSPPCGKSVAPLRLPPQECLRQHQQGHARGARPDNRPLRYGAVAHSSHQPTHQPTRRPSCQLCVMTLHFDKARTPRCGCGVGRSSSSHHSRWWRPPRSLLGLRGYACARTRGASRPAGMRRLRARVILRQNHRGQRAARRATRAPVRRQRSTWMGQFVSTDAWAVRGSPTPGSLASPAALSRLMVCNV